MRKYVVADGPICSEFALISDYEDYTCDETP
jgi:hypothetical protein